MMNWECPECSEPCKDVKEHVTHIIEKHMLENAAKSPSRTQKHRRQPSGKDGDSNTAKKVPNKTIFTCPFPGCENHRKVYKRKQHLKRHYLDRKTEIAYIKNSHLIFYNSRYSLRRAGRPEVLALPHQVRHFGSFDEAY